MKKKVKVTRDVDGLRLKCLVYTAYMLGFMSAKERKSLDNPDNFTEIKKVIELIYK